jgi:hypothetical protein
LHDICTSASPAASTTITAFLCFESFSGGFLRMAFKISHAITIAMAANSATIAPEGGGGGRK